MISRFIDKFMADESFRTTFRKSLVSHTLAFMVGYFVCGFIIIVTLLA